MLHNVENIKANSNFNKLTPVEYVASLMNETRMCSLISIIPE